PPADRRRRRPSDPYDHADHPTPTLRHGKGLRQARLKAGITSLANQRNCSMNSAGDRPSAQWTMKSSRPGYLASIDLIPSMTSEGLPQNQAFCFTPSRNVGMVAGAPGVPQV